MAGIGLYIASSFEPPEYSSASSLITRPSYVPRTCRTAQPSARRGQPGYFAHLDRDKDGISCEPRPR
ncbi:excalibur calcium-binding domain-containing protein [Phyllobacterium zundukense]|uniref:excalibur calcium-binding domain-containing protein n=1 Tax=Phyllobacterium zundukense TaxID=1867719 RepID=UPI003965BDEF